MKQGGWPTIMVALCTEFEVTLAPMRDLHRNYWGQRNQGVAFHKVDLHRKRKGVCGRSTVLTEGICEDIITTNDKFWGRLSTRKLTGKLMEMGHNFSYKTIWRWCQALECRRLKRYIKPKLRRRHKINRIKHVLDDLKKDRNDNPLQYDSETLGEKVYHIVDFDDVVHLDEKWFYLLHDGTPCRVFPNADGTFTFPNPARCRHKSHIPKVMFMCVIAKPRKEYGFDGKIGVWSFTVKRKAKRSNSATGTVAGVTDILEDVSVTAEVYRQKMTQGPGSVFAMIREKMWWFKEGARFQVGGCQLVTICDYVAICDKFPARDLRSQLVPTARVRGVRVDDRSHAIDRMPSEPPRTDLGAGNGWTPNVFREPSCPPLGDFCSRRQNR